MSGAERSSNLRARLNAGESIVMPGVWDALSARLVHQAGFSTAFVSGFAVSGTLLGKPDVGYLTQVEMGAVAQRVCDAAPLLNAVVDAVPPVALVQLAAVVHATVSVVTAADDATLVTDVFVVSVAGSSPEPVTVNVADPISPLANT